MMIYFVRWLWAYHSFPAWPLCTLPRVEAKLKLIHEPQVEVAPPYAEVLSRRTSEAVFMPRVDLDWTDFFNLQGELWLFLGLWEPSFFNYFFVMLKQNLFRLDLNWNVALLLKKGHYKSVLFVWILGVLARLSSLTTASSAKFNVEPSWR